METFVLHLHRLQIPTSTTARSFLYSPEGSGESKEEGDQTGSVAYRGQMRSGSALYIQNRFTQGHIEEIIVFILANCTGRIEKVGRFQKQIK